MAALTSFILIAPTGAFGKPENIPGFVFAQITDNNVHDREPRVPGGSPIGAPTSQVVWRGKYKLPGATSTAADFEVMHYDGSVLTQVTDNATDDFRPVANNLGEIAWQAFGADLETEIYSLDKNANCLRITHDVQPVRDRYPDINDAGMIVWGRTLPALGNRLAAYDLRSETYSESPGFYGYRPHINAANHVTYNAEWIRYPDGTLIETGPEEADWGYGLWRRSESNNFDQLVVEANPAVSGADVGPRDVVLWDGDEVRVLYQSPVWAGRGDINDAGVVAFEGFGGLPGSTSGTADREIFVYDLATDVLTQLTDDDVWDMWPNPADDGSIYWMGYGGYAGSTSVDTDWEILQACPDADGDGVADNGQCQTVPGTSQIATPATAVLPLQCASRVPRTPSCGLGTGLAVLLPGMLAIRRRRNHGVQL